MDLPTKIVLLLGIYFIVLIAVGLYTRHTEKNSAAFTNANRKASFLLITASLFALIGGGELITMATLSYSSGYGAMALFGGVALGLFLLAGFGRKISKLSNEKNFYTLSGFFHAEYGVINSWLAAGITVTAFFSLLMVQLVAGGQLLAVLLGWPYELTVMTMAGVILIYLFAGGFRSVLNTDLIQAAVMLALAVVMLMYIEFPPNTDMEIQIESMPVLVVIQFIVIGCFVIIASADVWQRVFANTSVVTARWALIVAGILFLFYGVFLSKLGLAARIGFPDIDPNDAFFIAITELVPENILPFAFMMIFAAIMSTADSEAFLVSQTIVKDFRKDPQSLDSDMEKKQSRSIIAFILLLAGSLSLIFTNLILIYFSLISLVLILSPSVIASIISTPSRSSVFLSITCGLIGAVALVISGHFTPENSSLVLPAAFIGLLIGYIPSLNSWLDGVLED